MTRRDIIKSMGMVTLHALYPSVLTSFLSACAESKKVEAWSFFDSEEQVIIKEIIDVLLPKTNTKSATEAGVHNFLDQVFAHCLTPDQKDLIKEGLMIVKSEWNSVPDKTRYVRTLDNRAYMRNEDFAWFKIIKQYTLIGFFTSEVGTTEVTDYQKLPERFVGDIPMDQNTLVHAKTFLKFYF